MRRPLDEVRARIERRQSEHELHRAQRQAEAAEEDAADAVAAAEYFLNVAEYSVVDAALARMAADDLAAAKSSGPTS
jgi:phage shock protein A